MKKLFWRRIYYAVMASMGIIIGIYWWNMPIYTYLENSFSRQPGINAILVILNFGLCLSYLMRFIGSFADEEENN